MNIHEYQSKELFKKYSIPVPEGCIVSKAEEVKDIISKLGSNVVVKAQVHAGGRGKAGGVKVVSSLEEAIDVSSKLINSNLVTYQTTSEGVPVKQVLIEKVSNIKTELYLGMLVDASSKSVVCIASEFGGVDIEEIARTNPDKILSKSIHPVLGLQPYQARQLAYGLKIPGSLVRSFSTILLNLYNLFQENDCSMIEINPLVITKEEEIFALDAKINFDEDALFRQKNIYGMRDPFQEDSREIKAREADLSYVKLDGNVGCLVNGAGLAMATMDVISESGSKPANFLDVGGGADENKVSEAMQIICSDSEVEKIFVNLFGGILRCDIAARGIVMASQKVEMPPVVVRMLGTNADEGRDILLKSGLKVKLVNNLADAANELKLS